MEIRSSMQLQKRRVLMLAYFRSSMIFKVNRTEVEPYKNKWINFTWSKRKMSSIYASDSAADLFSLFSVLSMRPRLAYVTREITRRTDPPWACLETSLWRHSSHFSPFLTAFWYVVFLLHLMLLWLKDRNLSAILRLNFSLFCFLVFDQSSFQILCNLTLATVAMILTEAWLSLTWTSCW